MVNAYCSHCNKQVPIRKSGFGRIGGLSGNARYTCTQCGNDVVVKSNYFLLVLLGILTLFLLIQSVSAYSATVNISTTQTIGQIRPDFYGMSLGNAMSEYNNVSTSASCTLNVTANYTRERDAYLALGTKIARLDMLIGYNVNYTDLNPVLGITKDKMSAISNVKWAYQNNISIYMIAKDTPNNLGNTTSGCSAHTCPPLNYTQRCLTIRNYINNVTENGKYLSAIAGIEAWNEPESPTYWLSNLDTSDGSSQIRSKFFNELYNNTYDCVKTYYPTLKVGGTVGAALNVNQGQIMFNNWLGNFSNKFDFIDGHGYWYDGQNITEAFDTINYMNTRCTFYGANCSNIVLSEFNIANKSYFNTPTQSAYLGANYISILNTYQRNVTLIPFTFSSEYLKESCAGGFNQTAYNSITNETFTLYNITQSFVKSHKAGNTVLNSSSNDTILKVVASTDGTKTYITLTNVNSTATNVTLNIPLTNSYLRDVSTNTIYPIQNNQVTINNLAGYGVMTMDSNLIIITANFTSSNGTIGASAQQKYYNGTGYNASTTLSNISVLSSYISTACNILLNNTLNSSETVQIIFNYNLCGNNLIDTSNGNLISNGSSIVLNAYDVRSLTTIYTSQINGVGYFNNYLGEPIRQMSEEEHDQYFPNSLGCDSNYFAGSNLILILSALALVSFTFFFMFKDGFQGVDAGKLVMLAIVILVCLALFIGSAQNLTGYCN